MFAEVVDHAKTAKYKCRYEYYEYSIQNASWCRALQGGTGAGLPAAGDGRLQPVRVRAGGGAGRARQRAQASAAARSAARLRAVQLPAQGRLAGYPADVLQALQVTRQASQANRYQRLATLQEATSSL